MKILFLSRWYPDPPDNGSKIRIWNMLQALCGRHRVSLISFVDPDQRISPAQFPGPGPVDIKVCPYREFRPDSCRALMGLLSKRPRWLADTHSPEMEALICRALDKDRFDLIIASQTVMASYCRCFQRIPALFEEVELGGFYPDPSAKQSWLTAMRGKLRWAKHRRYVTNLMAHFSLCTVTSEVERRMLSEFIPADTLIRVLPNSINLDTYVRPPMHRVPDSLIFAGSLRYAANLDAMKWFIDEIFPIIRSKRKNAVLIITGDPGAAHLPISPGIRQTGAVHNVLDRIAASAVSVAPIRIGGGTRLKILESFAMRTPVVATSKAAEGLDVANRKHLLLADTPEAFANSVLAVLEDPNRSIDWTINAFNLVRAHYDWKILSRNFLEAVDQAAGTNG